MLHSADDSSSAELVLSYQTRVSQFQVKVPRLGINRAQNGFGQLNESAMKFKGPNAPSDCTKDAINPTVIPAATDI